MWQPGCRGLSVRMHIYMCACMHASIHTRVNAAASGTTSTEHQTARAAFLDFLRLIVGAARFDKVVISQHCDAKFGPLIFGKLGLGLQHVCCQLVVFYFLPSRRPISHPLPFDSRFCVCVCVCVCVYVCVCVLNPLTVQGRKGGREIERASTQR